MFLGFNGTCPHGIPHNCQTSDLNLGTCCGIDLLCLRGCLRCHQNGIEQLSRTSPSFSSSESLFSSWNNRKIQQNRRTSPPNSPPTLEEVYKSSHLISFGYPDIPEWSTNLGSGKEEQVRRFSKSGPIPPIAPIPSQRPTILRIPGPNFGSSALATFNPLANSPLDDHCWA